MTAPIPLPPTTAVRATRSSTRVKLLTRGALPSSLSTVETSKDCFPGVEASGEFQLVDTAPLHPAAHGTIATERANSGSTALHLCRMGVVMPGTPSQGRCQRRHHARTTLAGTVDQEI